MQAALKSLVMCGFTGHGKSSCGNTLMGYELFKVSDETSSCTVKVEKGTNQKYIVFDTVGLGDTSMAESKVQKQLAEAIVTEDNVQGKIDAFLLVFSFIKRMTQFKECLQALLNIFGPNVLQSTVLLLIDKQRKSNLPELLSKINEHMPQVREIICQSRRQETVDESWVMLWDNHQPYPQQADQLAKLLQKCRPYNHTQYLQHVQEQQVKLLTDFRARLLVTAQKYREKVNQEKLEAATFIQKNYAQGEARALQSADNRLRGSNKQLRELIFAKETAIASEKRRYQLDVAAENSRFDTQNFRIRTEVEKKVTRGQNRAVAQNSHNNETQQNINQKTNRLKALQNTKNSAIKDIESRMGLRVNLCQRMIKAIKDQIQTRKVTQPQGVDCLHCKSSLGFVSCQDLYDRGYLHLSCITPYYLSQRRICSQCKVPILLPSHSVDRAGTRTHRRCLGSFKQVKDNCQQGHSLISMMVDAKVCKCRRKTGIHVVMVCPECLSIQCPFVGKV